MKTRIFQTLSTVFLLSSIVANGQSGTAHEMSYSKNAYEYIFSGGSVNESSSSVDGKPVSATNPVRFSAFLNMQEQFHFDFSKNVGIYTGIGVRNIGFIHDFKDSLNNKIKVKQRQYALGVPLAFKLGNMPKNIYIAFGGELELFFSYKQKVFYNNRKDKYDDWFSSNSELLNPSVFAEVNFPKGTFIRFRYYLNDFLKENPNGVDLNNGKLNYDFTPSTLMYLSIGTALEWDDMDKARKGKAGNQRASL